MNEQIIPRAMISEEIINQNEEIEIGFNIVVESVTGKIKELKIQYPQGFMFSINELVGWTSTINHYLMQGVLVDSIKTTSEIKP